MAEFISLYSGSSGNSSVVRCGAQYLIVDMGKGVRTTTAALKSLGLAMNLGLLPSASITIPFFSAGGSNMVSSYILTGLVLSIYRYKDILPGNPVKRMHPASAE